MRVASVVLITFEILSPPEWRASAPKTLYYTGNITKHDKKVVGGIFFKQSTE